MVSSIKGSLKSKQIEDKLRALIAAELKPGEPLLPELRLAAAYGVGRVTVRRAIQNLEREGLLDRIQGRGTFVVDNVKRLDLLGLLIHARSDAYAMSLVKAIHEAASKRGLKLRSATADGYGADALREANQFAADGCSALIIPWNSAKDVDALPAFVEKSPLPTVLASSIPGLERNSYMARGIVGVNTRRKTKAVCEYFRLLGSKRVALLCSSDDNAEAQANLSAYSDFVYKHAMENLTAPIPLDATALDALAARWSAFKGDLTVVCQDDGYASAFMTAMHKLGLSAPGDFKIVGTNDSAQALYADPPLTSVRREFSWVAENLVRAAVAAAKGEQWQTEEINSSTLIVRDSCGGKGRLDRAARQTLASLSMMVETPQEAKQLEETFT